MTEGIGEEWRRFRGNFHLISMRATSSMTTEVKRKGICWICQRKCPCSKIDKSIFPFWTFLSFPGLLKITSRETEILRELQVEKKKDLHWYSESPHKNGILQSELHKSYSKTIYIIIRICILHVLWWKQVFRVTVQKLFLVSNFAIQYHKWILVMFIWRCLWCFIS